MFNEANERNLNKATGKKNVQVYSCKCNVVN